MDNEKKTCLCPILNRDIDGMDCFDAALVFEELSPLSELPKGMEYTEESAKICLGCKYHPE